MNGSNTFLWTCVHVGTCLCGCTCVCWFTWTCKNNPGVCHLPPYSSVFQWPTDHQLRWPGWPVSPAVSCLYHLHLIFLWLQACASKPPTLLCASVTQTQALVFARQVLCWLHVNTRTPSPALRLLNLDTSSCNSHHNNGLFKGASRKRKNAQTGNLSTDSKE